MASERRVWTAREDRALFELAAKGFTWERIGQELGRSKDGCSSYYRDAVRRKGKQPARKAIKVRVAKASPEALASEALRVNMIEAFRRFASEHHVAPDEAQRILMGDKPKPIPGTETFFKTSAVRRLAA